jgi:hypothetical protein
VIAKLRHDKSGASERGRKLLGQLKLEPGELVATAAEDATRAENQAGNPARSTAAAQALPRSSACPPAARAGGAPVTRSLSLLRRDLSKLGEGVTKILGVIPRQ